MANSGVGGGPSAGTLHLSYGPHVRSGESTSSIMWQVNLALLPALIWAVGVFGVRPLLITLAAVLGCVAGEQLFCLLQKRRTTLTDGTAVCSGMLLAFTLPPGLSPWMATIGGFLAITLTKGVFGGLGHNIFNVALIGRAMMMASFPVAMTTKWIPPQLGNFFPPDALTTATPLAILKEKGFEAALASFYQGGGEYDYLWRLALGLRPGSIGEVSVLCILLGAAFLLLRGIIKLWIPLSIFAGLGLVSLLSTAPLLHLFSGGVWLGAFFMATDYVTSPSTPKGQIVFGVGIGLLTGLIRLYGGYPEGICYAILLMNIVVPALNDWFRPKRVSTMGVPS
ncbi:MAG: RnfABCDGE type electron transport complex subunit D [Oligoflexia bacterium]|nr:RnfABCDGE type electron transport complex subunit D [Oligoflexia bacterium]